jgi:hypothetical protein
MSHIVLIICIFFGESVENQSRQTRSHRTLRIRVAKRSTLANFFCFPYKKLNRAAKNKTIPDINK